MKALDFRHTIVASCAASVTMAATTNLAPLLFLIFNESLGVALSRITVLITLNFVIQLTVDLLAALFADRVGYRPLMIASALLSAGGLVALGSLPFVFADAWIGLLIADILCALGAGLAEALVSPIVEACPTKNKVAMMGLLHSFYCWGTVVVILLSTLFLYLTGEDSWWLLPLLWSLLPFLNAVLFALVPFPTPEGATSDGNASPSLLRRPAFWLFLLVMVAAGASELSMSQWASAFAEAGLGVSKAVGDLAGPCLYAALMGTARVFYAKMSERIDLRFFLTASGILAIGGYLLSTLAPSPALALVGCAVTGLSVGILWPGSLSLAARRFPSGGTLMFSLCALCGDLGCSIGPTVVGLVADAGGGDITGGLFYATAFPVLFVLLLLLGRIGEKKSTSTKETDNP